MMDTTFTSYVGPGFFVAGVIHTLGGLAACIGVFFLLVWAVKSLSHKQLKTWGAALLVGGFVVCLLTALTFGGMRSARYMMNYGSVRSGMMGGVWDDGAGADSDATDMMDRSMNGMTMMLKGKAGDDFDKAFIEAMIPHHQGAIDMAELALQSAKHQEIKNMATAIIKAQQKEIDEMKQWYNNWGYAQ
jgi:cytochrome bd-type quinol oxidase subunit 1